MEQPSCLTYKALNERIDRIPEHPFAVIGLTTREKRSYATALLAIALCFLSAKVLPDDQWYTVAITGFFFLVEMVAIIVALIPKWPPRFPGFRSDRNEYVEQLDHDFKHHLELIAWIAQFPREQIAQLADYAELRQERSRERQPLLVGGVEKLGILPVLIAAATQFKGMHWPPELTWPEILLYLFATWLYWLCLISIATRHRGRVLEVALKRALVVKDKETVQSISMGESTPGHGIQEGIAVAR